MNTAYTTAANKAVAHERAYEFHNAGMMWLAAQRYASGKNIEHCELRAEFCQKFGKYLERDND
ncbi:ANR family transcriptional regulator [Dickeya poaceiphila]|uniref:ANR family transcriptional regulator n=1 Tax=Dickeya poaceiphila TaxID=568768 RepID=A0A5B8I4I3_9GAMM|nr:ANR family transcriptional regulator [Dickeya poaceiphila]QDX29503.1 ANR family transcriptional regulator [Dickeya poaceiphila]